MTEGRQPLEGHKEDMNIVIVGHVDHGKSTIVGRLMADTHSLPQGKLEQVKETCRKNSKPFEYAFLLDALKDEQAQGITIDSARCFFKTAKRDYIIIDAPGHIEFLKNMVTGAARAEAALLVIDAHEGVQENSRRHGYMLSMLGIKQIAVLINKMDLVDYREEAFNRVTEEYLSFLKQIGIEPNAVLPVSGMEGDNIALASDRMTWYNGPTVLEILDRFQAAGPPAEKPFRMPVQAVYKFTRDGDNRRIVAGTVEAGRLKVGDEVVFYPTGKRSKVKSIEYFNGPKPSGVTAGQAAGFTLEEQIYVTRGDMATVSGQPQPQVTSRLKANVFWLGKQPLERVKTYHLKIGAAKVGAKIEEITRVIDASNLNTGRKDKIERHDVAECIIKLDRAIAFDLAGVIDSTGRFVIVDDYEIAGGGIALEALEDRQSWVREKVYQRNVKWEKSTISSEDRAEKYNQKSILILLTGKQGVGKKEIAKGLEKRLFDDGKIVYFLGIGNLLYGIDADIKSQSNNNKAEHFRRLAELAHIMLDAGMIMIVTARELNQNDLETIKTTINPERVQTIWVGEDVTTDLAFDLHLSAFETIEQAVDRVKRTLQEKGIIFRPW